MNIVDHIQKQHTKMKTLPPKVSTHPAIEKIDYSTQNWKNHKLQIQLSELEWVVLISHNLKTKFLLVIYQTSERYTNTITTLYWSFKNYSNIQTERKEFHATRWKNNNNKKE